MIEEGGFHVEGLLLLDGGGGDLIVGPKAFARDSGEHEKAGCEEGFQTHDRLILVDRQGEGQAKIGFRRRMGDVTPKGVPTPDSLELIGIKSELTLKDCIPRAS